MRNNQRTPNTSIIAPVMIDHCGNQWSYPFFEFHAAASSRHGLKMADTPINNDEPNPVPLLLSVLTSLFALISLGSDHSGAGMTVTEFALLFALIPLQFLAFGLVIYGTIQVFKTKRERGYFIAVVLFAIPLPALTIIAFVKASP